MNNKIAFFDFDGTITHKDTLPEIIRFIKGRRAFYLGMIQSLPWLIAMKLKIISNASAKEKLLAIFFKGLAFHEFQQKCNEFIQFRLPHLLRPAAISEINKYKQEGTTVVVVSASVEDWIVGWCDHLQIKCLATRLEVINGKITGRIAGKNCNGTEKVNRIKALFNLNDYKTIIAYGDSNGDKPMLSLAAIAYYKPFR
ncbi:MAG: haloacid dehalogenase-like hydrolase [Chitinophagaceae bacterium]|nr:haloacid dehalogenase-like hydrolase [Chitinophagaceae bacterium]